MSRAKAIFDAVTTAITGLTTTENRVFANRQYALPKDYDNALSISMGADLPIGGEDQPFANNAYMDKLFQITITIHVKATSAQIDDEILKIASEIWQAIMADYTLGLAYVFKVNPGGMEEPEAGEIAEKPSWTANTVWNVHYRHSLTNPGA